MAIPKITAEFNGLDDVGWYAAAYFMTFGAAMSSAGKAFQYNNLKWSFIVSMIIFEIGSLICGVAPNSETLIVGRAIAGLGGAGLSVGGTSIISLTVEPKKRPMMMVIVGATYCVAAVLGPLLGGAFTDAAAYVLSLVSNETRDNVISAYFSRTDGARYTVGRVPIGSSDFFLHTRQVATSPPNLGEIPVVVHSELIQVAVSIMHRDMITSWPFLDTC